MKRTSLFLRTGQIKKLKMIAKRTGAPVAELIRRAVDELIERQIAAEKGEKGENNDSDAHS